MVTPSQALQNSTRTEYQNLHDTLSKAREVCVDGRQSDLRHIADQVQAVLTALDRDDLRSRTAEFEAVGTQIARLNEDMQALKAEIDKIVQDVIVAAEVVSAIDSTATAAGRMFA